MADPLKSNVGAADPADPNHHSYIRKQRSTDQLMRQFLKLESGVGNSPAYIRGHVWNFSWHGTPGEPEKVAAVEKLMSEGKTFEEAFDAVAGTQGTDSEE